MMRTLRISDAARCILLNVSKGPNLVCPKESICSGEAPGNLSLWKDALIRRRNRVSLVSWHGPYLSGLGSARNRNGRRVWEVNHLYVPAGTDRAPGHPHPEPWDSVFLDLLEALVREVGARLGERIIVRLPTNSPAVFQARRSGFFPSHEESLIEGAVSPQPAITMKIDHFHVHTLPQEPSVIPTKAGIYDGTVESRSRTDTAVPAGLSDRLRADDHGLFQLFCASTPHEVREKLGLTFDQWRDAREPSKENQREWVLRHNDRVMGWLCVKPSQGVLDCQVMTHPDLPGSLPHLLDLALSQGGVQQWLVPEYQEHVRDCLLRYGLRETSRYTLLVKRIAAPVRKHVMAAVEA